ncbi:nuclear transport factor 2 family protein [Cryobacterium sp. MDB1-18-2]|uniref:Nuclear transport factor 2 family protein n=1 Tax=Cryobacterium glucosi TaxID=1259175 RepID=A0ABY2IST9_9MICO|nr:MULTISPECIES: nuclear transport factor 2 family protein [Cryobacterium]MDY7527640.1 nuclear transport factor 2 family protein [Cryobacterium sp. 10C2]MEB0004527.1 nuclear transport factor 2 family protein [Cryobacterium sp. RTC2.1]MEB0200623.1 nuclear transport factor 2 family protein [Cryobacterium sp. 5I3]MEB0287323.1 nuclear transport factor 2 family protein [Cryobacterium sp. 10S3]MEB0288947.1 nuclear transport factor 2 family protein [Cryobacterium sp. 10C2]
MSDLDVRESFLRAITDNDPEAMREGLERLFGLTKEGLSPDAEFRLRDETYVMEMPQSGERIRGREAMRAMQEAFPVPPSITLRRVVGSGQIWVVEGTNDYAGDVWHVVVILEFGADGSIIRDTRYYTRKSEAPGWRSEWVEPLD